MASDFFSVLIGDELVRLEKSRVIEIEPAFQGTKITIEASHLEEEPIVYTTHEPYEAVMQSYSS